MTGPEIRRLRLQHGLTQAELAARIGCSQPQISNLESGRVRSSLWSDRIRRELSSPERNKRTAPARAVDLFARASVGLVAETDAHGELAGHPIRSSIWTRPRISGDLGFVVRVPRDYALLVALDVVGHGQMTVPAALYLRGWIRGWVGNLATPPLLQAFVSDLADELRTAKLAVALFAALIGRGGRARNTTSYQAISCGFPSPILVAGPPPRTLRSCELTSALPNEEADDARITRHEITSPWRLAIASDGLLARLGGGDERAGARSLMRHHMSFEREHPAESFLATDVPEADDELHMLVESTAWDMITTSAIEEAERARAVEVVCQRALATLGRSGVERLRVVMLEAIDNVQIHSGASTFVLRCRDEGDAMRVEVLDEGVGMSEELARTERRGFSVMRRHADGVDVRANHPRGTIVSFALRAEEV